MEAVARSARFQQLSPPVERFAAALPWSTILASDDFAKTGAYPRPRIRAERMREIAPDPAGWLTALRLDVDRADAATAWREAGLPEPSFIVENPVNGHAHYVYGLDRWVRTGTGNDRAMRYAEAVRRAMTAALPGADPAYCGRFHHNPLSSAYRTHHGRAEPYSLGELAAAVDLTAVRSLRSRRPTSSGVGRNVDTFNALRVWAYRAVAGYKSTEDLAGWKDAVADRAAKIAAEISTGYSAGPLADRELKHLVASVAGWVWHRYTAARSPAAAAMAANVARFKARERSAAARAIAGCQTRDAYLARTTERRADALRLHAEGWPTAKIAEALNVAGRTVRNYLAGTRQSPCVASGTLPRETGFGTREPREDHASEPIAAEPLAEAEILNSGAAAPDNCEKLTSAPPRSPVDEWISGLGFPFGPVAFALPLAAGVSPVVDIPARQKREPRPKRVAAIVDTSWPDALGVAGDTKLRYLTPKERFTLGRLHAYNFGNCTRNESTNRRKGEELSWSYSGLAGDPAIGELTVDEWLAYAKAHFKRRGAKPWFRPWDAVTEIPAHVLDRAWRLGKPREAPAPPPSTATGLAPGLETMLLEAIEFGAARIDAGWLKIRGISIEAFTIAKDLLARRA